MDNFVSVLKRVDFPTLGNPTWKRINKLNIKLLQIYPYWISVNDSKDKGEILVKLNQLSHANLTALSFFFRF